MAARTLPPLLKHYLALPPEASLLMLSGILGASTNWLVLRHLAALLGSNAAGAQQQQTQRQPQPRRVASLGDDQVGERDGDGGEEETAVLLVSFLRDFAFWRDSAGRLRVDLPALAKKGRFGFVDGLTGLFSQVLPPQAAGPGQQQPRTSRRLVWGQPRQGMQGIAATLHEAVDELLKLQHTPAGGSGPRRKLVLVVDQPDLLLAAAGPEATVTELRNMLMDLREKVHACIVTISADEPLVSVQTTTLEREHASLLLSLAHEARTVLSLRLLDTGTANDVSGVLRITRGGADADDDGEDGSRGVEEHEYLYHVGGDGGVRVFERGGH